MNKTKLQQIKDIQTPDELFELLGVGSWDIADISYRGGTLGFYAKTIARFADVDEWLLPNKFGAYCNYLGGGLRGSIVASDFDSKIKGYRRDWLEALGDAIVRLYNYYEQEENLQDDEYPDGETNWDNLGTKANRQAGVISAY